MQKVERLSITLPVEMARMVRAKVDEGRYASNSEVIREAMRSWQEKEKIRDETLAIIRAKIDEADNDPRPSLSEAEVDQHFEERLKRSLAARKDHA